jgi:hypothetical protein
MKANKEYEILNRILNGFRPDKACTCSRKDNITNIKTMSPKYEAMFSCLIGNTEGDDYKGVTLKNINVSPDAITGNKEEKPILMCSIPEFCQEQTWELNNSMFIRAIKMASNIRPNAVFEINHIGKILSINSTSEKEKSILDEHYLANIDMLNFKGDRSVEGWILNAQLIENYLTKYISTVKRIAIATQSYTDNPYPLKIKFELSTLIYCEYIQSPIIIQGDE